MECFNLSLINIKVLNQATLGWFFIEVGMNIPEMRGMGLISTPKFDVLLNGERQKALSEDAKESAKQAAAQIHEILKKRYPNAVKK